MRQRGLRGLFVCAGLVTQGVFGATATYALALDCHASDAASQPLTLDLPAALDLSFDASARAVLTVEERGADVDVQVEDGDGVRSYDLSPAGWAIVAVALESSGANRTRVTLIARSALVRSGQFVISLRCQRAGAVARDLDILRSLDAAALALQRSEDDTLNTTDREHARQRALNLLRGVEVAGLAHADLRWVVAQSLHAQGFLLARMGQPKQSGAAFAKAAAAWIAAGDAHRAQWAKLREAQQLRRQGGNVEAQRLLAAVAAAPAAASDPGLRGMAVNDQCLILSIESQLPQARECYLRAERFQMQAGDIAERALAIANAADIDLSLGHFAEAAEQAQRAIGMARLAQSERAELIATILHGNALRALGQLDDALATYVLADALSESLGDPSYEANLRRQTGKALMLLSDLPRAETFLRESADIYERGGYWSNAGRTLVVLAGVSHARGDIDTARKTLLQALALFDEHAVREGVIDARLLLAQICLDQRDAVCAQRELATITARTVGVDEYPKRQRLNLLRAQSALIRGDRTAARSTTDKALVAARKAGDLLSAASAQELLGDVDRAQNDQRAAAEHYLESMRLRAQVARAQTYPLHAALLMQGQRHVLERFLAASLRADGRGASGVSRRLAAVESMRAEAASGFARAPDPADTATRSERERLLALINDAVRRHWELDTSAVADSMNPKLDDLVARLELLDRRVGRAAGIEPADRTNAFVEQLRSRIPVDVAVLSVFSGERFGLRWVTTASGTDETEIPAASVLAGLARRLTELAADPGSDATEVREAANALAAGLALRTDAAIAAQHWFLVGDGLLADTPMALAIQALQQRTDAGGTNATIDATLLPSLRNLLEDDEPMACCADGALFAFADPTTGEASTSVGVASAALRQSPLTRLPGSRTEVAAIAKLWGVQRSTVWQGVAATRGRALAALSHSGAIVHFATHGLVSRQTPTWTGLLLVDDDATPQLGVLSWHDILAHSVRARLVVLGACDAAAGTALQQEGTLGLSRAFLYAGAADVVAPLWPVNDSANSALMKHFYAALAHGQQPGPALVDAQAAMAADRRFGHPFYWAGMLHWSSGRPHR